MSCFGGKRGCCSPPCTSVIYRGGFECRLTLWCWTLKHHVRRRAGFGMSTAPKDGQRKLECGGRRRLRERETQGNGRMKEEETQNSVECLCLSFRDFFKPAKEYLYFLLGIYYGLTPFMRMMQGESWLRLFLKEQVRSDRCDKLSSDSQWEKTC